MPLTYYIKFLRSLKNQMLQSTPTRILPVLIVTQNLKKKKKKRLIYLLETVASLRKLIWNILW